MALKVGIIGVGGIARSHVPGWLASDDAELIAGCDVDQPTLKNWGRETRVEKLYSDHVNLLADPDVDIVDICTPSSYHAPLAIAALEAGKHVLCEKPLAPAPGEIEGMIEARERSGRLLMTAQHFRFTASAIELKREVDTGVLGDIYHARGWMLRRGLAPTRASFVSRQHSGGGACIDIGVHILDLAMWMMGHPKPVAVSGTSRTELAHREGAFTTMGGVAGIPAEFDVEEFAAAFVRFENGASLILEVSWLLHHDPGKWAGERDSDNEQMQLWLYGTDGGAEWPDCRILESNLETKQHYNRSLRLFPEPLEPHAQECVEFARAVAKGAPSPVPAEESLNVMKVLHGIYRSQEADAEVRID